MHSKISVVSLDKFPIVKKGDELGAIILNCINQNKLKLKNGDIICIAQKIVSKAEGCIYPLKDITPSKKALKICE